MHQYQEKQFNIPSLTGLSEKQMEEHLKLYYGYVKHVNLIREKIHELEEKDKDGNAYLVSELRRRFAFEFNGMRMHEYYFEEFELADGESPGEHDAAPKLLDSVSEKYGSFESFIEHFKVIAGGTRGVGWAVLYHDQKVNQPHTVWVEDHELGTLAGLPIIAVLDMWEHAYMVDYTPSEKKEYINAFLKNMNWNLAERRFTGIRQ